MLTEFTKILHLTLEKYCSSGFVRGFDKIIVSSGSSSNSAACFNS